jgi:hypothetical protein
VVTYLNETFTGSDGAAWSGSNWSTTGQDSGTATIQSNVGRLTTTSGSRVSRRTVASIPADQESSGQFRFGNGDAWTMLLFRANSAIDTGKGYYLYPYWNGTTADIGRFGTNAATNYVDTVITSPSVGFTFTTGTWVSYRFQLINEASRVVIRWKLWLTSGSEPSSWSVAYDTSADRITSAGSTGVTIGYSASRYVEYDNLVYADPTPATTPVTDTRTVSWATRSSRTNSRATTWRVLSRLLPLTRATSWTTNSTFTSVTASRSTTWTTRNRPVATRSTTWAVAYTGPPSAGVSYGTTTTYENASSTSVTLAKPAGTINGELLVAVVAHDQSGWASEADGYSGGYTDGYAATESVPTWTVAAHAESPGNSVAIFYRFATNDDPASYVFQTNLIAGPVSGTLTRVIGAFSVVDGGGIASPASATGLTLPALTTAFPSSAVLAAYTVDTTGTTVTVPSGMTQIATTTGIGVRLVVAQEARPTAGTVGTRTWAYSPTTTPYAQATAQVVLQGTAVTASRPTSWAVRSSRTASRATTWNGGGSGLVATRATTWETRAAVQPAQLSNPTASPTATYWGGNAGTGATATFSQQATGGPTGGPFYRGTWTVSQTGSPGNAGLYYSVSGTTDPALACNPGQFISASGWVRSSVSQRIALYVQYMDAASATLLSTTTQVVVDPNVWTFITLNQTQAAPAGTVRVRLLPYAIVGTGAVLWQAGDTLDATQLAISSTSSRSISWTSRAIRTRLVQTSWSTYSQTTTATFTPSCRLIVYSPLGATLGRLPAPLSVTAAFPLNDLGSLGFTYLARGPGADMLGQPCEIALELTPDDGATWFEMPNGRFIYTSDARNPLDPADQYDVTCDPYVKRFDKAITYPGGAETNEEGKREFLSKTPGAILKTLIDEAQARTALSGISYSFTAGADSAGVPWAKVLTIYYEPGISLWMILLNLAEQGFVDFRMQGRTLQVYNADTIMANDRTTGAGQVLLRSGRDLTEAPFRRTWEALADTAYFAGDQGTSYQYTNPSAIKPFGRQEVFISNGSVTDAGTMAAITQETLRLTDHERTEYTRGLDFTRSPFLPGFNYQVGDHVWSSVDGTSVPEKLRVRQLTITVSDRGVVSGNVVLNDRFLEADIRQRRRVEGITNGASGNAPIPEPPSPVADKKAPGQVLGLTASSSAYLGPGGYAQAQVTLNWAAVTENSDGTDANDIDRYEIYHRQGPGAIETSRIVATSPDTNHSLSPYVAGSTWRFKVRAVDQTGLRGAFSTEISIAMAADLTPPQAPSTPVATSDLGVVKIFWDGQPAFGSWEVDFDYVEVHASTVNNFTPTTGTYIGRLDGSGSALFTGGAYGVPIYAKLIAVDKAKLKSTPSAQASATPSRLVGSDLDPGAITYQQIAYKDVGNIVFDGSFETTDYQQTVLARSSTAWTLTTADAYHGTTSVVLDGAVGAGTFRNLFLMGTEDRQSIGPGEKLFCRFAYKGEPGAVGNIWLVVEWRSKTGVGTNAFIAGTLKNGVWQQVAQQVTAPADTATFRVYLHTNTGTLSGRQWVDAVEVRRTVGTAIIEDAAIGNAQIANLAVNDAKIANMAVGKLTAGQLNADVLIAASMRTATSGNRVDINSTGIYLYKGSVLKAHIDPAGGKFRVYGTGDVTHSSTEHAFQVGPDTGVNLIIDNNEIMSRFNGGKSRLHLNREGGEVILGGVVDATDTGTNVPKTNDHRIVMRGAVEIRNQNDGDYADEWPPLSIGWRSGQHLWFDGNEFGSSTADGVGILNIQPPKTGGIHHTERTYFASNSMMLFRMSAQNAAFVGFDGPECGFQFTGSNGVYVRTAGLTGFREIHASSFINESGRAVKTDVTELADDEDPLVIIKGARSTRWKYRNDIEPVDRWHVGPMADDLPDFLVDIGVDGRPGVDLGSLLGVLWEATRTLADRVAALEHPGPPDPVPDPDPPQPGDNPR